MGKLKRTSRNPVSDILRTIMYLKGKTPDEMAETIGVAYGTYSSRLRDGYFSIYELVALCDSCDMTITIQGEGVYIDLKEFLNDAHRRYDECEAEESTEDRSESE